jgi:osmotically inducible protein OsmC
MPTRSAKADWQGEFKRGGGSVSTETGVLDSPYNFSGRFESGTGTNPEELLAASHASCFTMALSVGLTQAGNPPESLSTEAKVTVAQVEGGFGITKIELSVTGKVPGLDADGFAAAAQGAKEGCPLSKALAAVPEITLETTFESQYDATTRARSLPAAPAFAIAAITAAIER